MKGCILDFKVGASAVTPNNDSFNFLKLSGYRFMHKQGYKGAGKTWAVLDTGVKATHPELNFPGKVYPGKNFATWGLPNTDVMDRMGHGTHVAATIAGGLKCGIAPLAKILPVKVLDDSGFLGDTEWLFDGLRYVISWRDENNKPVSGVNMSLGGSGWTTTEISTLRSLCDQINALGIPIVVSAGNTGNEQAAVYPACLDSVIAVSAVDVFKQTAPFTTTGIMVDVCQVGVDVLSADINSDLYVYMSGTSMASPITSGCLLLTIEKNEKLNASYLPLTGTELEKFYYLALKNNTIDLGVDGSDKVYGAGFVTFNQKIPTRLKFAQGSNILYADGVAETMPAPCYVYKDASMINGVSEIPMRTFGDKAEAITTYNGPNDIQMLV